MLVGIIDDDIEFLNKFKEEYCEKMFSLLLDNENECIISQTMLNYDELNKLDLVFFDILLENDNTIEMITNARDNFNTEFIFVSSNNNLVFDALRVRPLTFIRKSHLDDDFNFFMNTYMKTIVKNKRIKVTSKGRSEEILVDNIQYLTACGHDVTIVTGNKEFQLYSSLKKVLNIINDKRFVQIQKSTCINMDYISELNRTDVILKSGCVIKVSRFYIDTLKNVYFEYLLNAHV